MNDTSILSIAFIILIASLFGLLILGDMKGTERERTYWCEKTETLKIEFDKCMGDRDD